MKNYNIKEKLQNIRKITKHNPFYLFYLTKLCYFPSIFQSSFMNRTVFILCRGSVILYIFYVCVYILL